MAAARPSGASSGIGQALRNRRLRRVLVGFGAVNFAELASITSLSIYAFHVGGTLAVAFVGFRLLPGAVSSAVLAPLVDSRRHVLTRVAQVRFVLLGLAAAGVLAGVPIAIVLGVVSLDAVAAAPYRPAQARLVPALANAPAEVSASAAGISVFKSLGQAGGALAGGIAASLIAPGWVIAGGAVLMAGAAVITFGLSASRPRAMDRAPGGIGSGLRLFPRVLAHRDASPFVVLSGLRTLVRGLWSALLVVVALELLGLGRSGVGVLNAAIGAGALAALLITAALIGRARLAAPCALAFIGAGLALGLVGVLPVAIALIAVFAWGIAMAVADSTSLSLLARLLDARTLSHTVGVMESLKLGLEGVGALIAPVLVGLFGVRAALIVAGVPLPFVTLLSYQRMSRADSAAAGRGAVVSLLHGVDVLHSLDMASIEDVAARARPIHATVGTELVRQGEPGDAFYVIERGAGEVELDGFQIGRLDAGAGFGERALLRATPRTATVRAASDMALYAIDRTSFLSAITGEPPEALDDPSLRFARPGPDPMTRPLADVLGDVTFLRELDPGSLGQLAGGASIDDWRAGEVIIREGDAAIAFFVVLSGLAHTTIEGRKVSELLPGDCFGEISLLHGVPRTATVTAAEQTRTCRVSAEAVSGIIAAGTAGELRPPGEPASGD